MSRLSSSRGTNLAKSGRRQSTRQLLTAGRRLLVELLEDRRLLSVGSGQSALSNAWSTYVGGSGYDWQQSTAVDSTGNVYVAGYTSSGDFPTTSGVCDPTYNSGNDVFVAKFSSSGTLLWSTYLGGSGDDRGYGVAVDANGNVFVTGSTSSSNFSVTAGAFDTTYNGATDAFVVKLSSSGTLLWSTYLGGTDSDRGYGIAVDTNGDIFVTGETGGRSFPTTTGAYSGTLSGSCDVFVSKLSTTGGIQWSTYLGGSGADWGYSIAVDTSGNAYLTGYTSSNDFPVATGAYDTTYNGGTMDAFVAKFSSSGSLLWSTYLGGSGYDLGYSIAVDSAGNAYVTVQTGSNDIPTAAGAYDTSYNGGPYDAFLAKFSSSGSLLWSTYFGGNADDRGYGIAVDTVGDVYVTGLTRSTDLPTTAAAFIAAYNGGGDAYVAKFSTSGSLLWSSYLGTGSSDGGVGIAVDTAGNAYVTGYTQSSSFPATTGAFDATYNGGNDVFVVTIGGLVALNLPPVVNAGGPYVGVEGIAITFDAARTTDPEGDSLQYRWDFDNDGAWDTDWSSSPTATHAWTDNRTGSATVAVSDGHHVVTATASVTVNDLTPTRATISAPTDGYHGVRGQVRTFVLTATDPSPIDEAANFAFTIDWGDDARETVVCKSGETVSHVFTSTGIYVVNVTSVTDKDGGTKALVGVQRVLSISVAEVQDTALSVGGTAADNVLKLVADASENAISITLDDTFLGILYDSAAIQCFGQGGGDTIEFTGTTSDDSFAMAGNAIGVNGLIVVGDSVQNWLLTGLAGNDTFTMLGEQSAAVTINGGAGADALIGPDQTNLWQLTGTGTGVLNTTITFKGMENLSGGVGDDRFQIGAGSYVAGTIDGAGGSNTLDYSSYGRTCAVNLATQRASGMGGMANIEEFVGGSLADTFVGTNASTTWRLDGVASGIATWTADSGTVTAGFSGFENLTGGAGDDSFALVGSGSGFGTISGGNGTNTLDYSASTTGPVTVDLRSRSASNLTSFSSILRFVGSTTSDAFWGPNSTTSWAISGSNSGTVGAYAFSSFENLAGGSVNDTFTLTTATARVTGQIDGGDGVDALVAYNTDNTWTLTGAKSGNVNGTESFVGMENLTGSTGNDTFRLTTGASGFGTINGGAGADALIGPDQTNLWQLTGTGTGGLNTTITFKGIENLTGGAEDDTFQMGAGSYVAGTIDGAGGSNTLDYSSYGKACTVNLATQKASGVAGKVSSICVVVGSDGNDAVTANNGGCVLIGGAGDDKLYGGVGRDLLIGGSGADLLHGGAGEDILIGGLCSYYSESSKSLNLTAIIAIMAEWARTDLTSTTDLTGYEARYQHLFSSSSSGGLNGSYLLNSSTVQKDSGAVDSLFGEIDRDWFLASSEDLLVDRLTSGDQSEELTVI